MKKALVVGLLCALAQLPALSNGFVDWDDLDNFVRGPFPREGLSWALTTFYSGHYQPLTWLSLLPFPLTPFSVHAGNLLLHGVGAGLAALCARELFRGRESSPKALEAASLCAAFLWGLHPLRVEAVSWASERREVLATALLLGSTYAWLRGRRSAALPLYAASLLAKPTGALFAVMLWAAERARGRRLAPKQLAPFAALGAAAVLVAMAAQRQYGSTASFSDYGLFERLGVACYNAAFYLGKSLWPSALSPIYPLPERMASLYPEFSLSVVLVALPASAVFLVRRDRPGVAAAAVWYAAALLPVCGLVRGGPQLAADRFSHLAMLGPSVLAGAALLRLDGAALRAGCALAAAVCVSLAAAAHAQSRAWRDTETLWRSALAARPGLWTAHSRLGFELQRQERHEEALEQYALAVAANPDFAVARNNLGNALVRAGKVEEGLVHLREAVRLKPDHPAARANLEAALRTARRRTRK